MDKKDKVEKINAISPSFCLAKWTQVTLDLVHGTTHSCHHPKRHSVSIDAVRQNPSALHNTPEKKQARQEMLAGKRPSECQYCWNIEDTPGEHLSDRFVKSMDPWSWPFLKEVLECGSEGDYTPQYLEVMFDNACNFACSYCLADISSSIYKEMKKHGPYKVENSTHRMMDPNWKGDFKREENPFVEAFWKWLPEIWTNLKVLRVTGGEPFLSKHTFRLLEYCLSHPNKELELAFNSNLGIDRERLERYQKLAQTIRENEAVKSQELYVSVDSIGEHAEYIRRGLDYDQFLHNLQIFLEDKSFYRITLMCTFNILSIPHFDQFMETVEELKSKYPHLVLDMSYLKEPHYLKASLATSEMREKVFLGNKRVQESTLFDEFEKNKVGRIAHWLKVADEGEKLSGLRGDFFSFVNEYDKRYGTSFLASFPELKDFYILCKKERFLSSF